MLSRGIFNAEQNLEFFRWASFDSNERRDTGMEDEQRHELLISELQFLSSFSIEKMVAIDKTLGSV